VIQRVRRAIARLIDAYQDGLLERAEFEPRIKNAKDRLARLQAEAKVQAEQETEEQQLQLVIGQLKEFAGKVKEGLQDADWMTRREIIRALVKRIEIDKENIRVVYRVSPSPFADSPQRGIMQHCWRREHPTLRGSHLILLATYHPPPTFIVSFFDGHFQPHPDELQHLAVHNPAGHRFHQLVMGNGVEIPG